jgi:hypothetical protein
MPITAEEVAEGIFRFREEGLSIIDAALDRTKGKVISAGASVKVMEDALRRVGPTVISQLIPGFEGAVAAYKKMGDVSPLLKAKEAVNGLGAALKEINAQLKSAGLPQIIGPPVMNAAGRWMKQLASGKKVFMSDAEVKAMSDQIAKISPDITSAATPDMLKFYRNMGLIPASFMGKSTKVAGNLGLGSILASGEGSTGATPDMLASLRAKGIIPAQPDLSPGMKQFFAKMHLEEMFAKIDKNKEESEESQGRGSRGIGILIAAHGLNSVIRPIGEAAKTLVHIMGNTLTAAINVSASAARGFLSTMEIGLNKLGAGAKFVVTTLGTGLVNALQLPAKAIHGLGQALHGSVVGTVTRMLNIGLFREMRQLFGKTYIGVSLDQGSAGSFLGSMINTFILGASKGSVEASNLQQSLQKLVETVGGAAAPYFRALNTVIQQTVSWYEKLDDGVKRSVVQGGLLTLGLSAVISLLPTLASVISGLLSPIGFAASMLSAILNPLDNIIAFSIDAGLAITNFLLKGLIGIVGYAASAAVSLTHLAVVIASNVIGGFVSLVTTIITAGASLLALALIGGPLAVILGGLLLPAAIALAAAFTAIFVGLSGQITAVFGANVLGGAVSLIQSLVSGVKSAFTGVGELAGAVGNQLPTAFEKVRAYLSSWKQDWQGAFANLIINGATFWNKLISGAEVAINTIKNAFSEMGNYIIATFEVIGARIDKFRNAVQEMQDRQQARANLSENRKWWQFFRFPSEAEIDQEVQKIRDARLQNAKGGVGGGGLLANLFGNIPEDIAKNAAGKNPLFGDNVNLGKAAIDIAKLTNDLKPFIGGLAGGAANVIGWLKGVAAPGVIQILEGFQNAGAGGGNKFGKDGTVHVENIAGFDTFDRLQKAAMEQETVLDVIANNGQKGNDLLTMLIDIAKGFMGRQVVVPGR